MKIVTFPSYSVQLCKDNPHTLFLFGDNLNGYGSSPKSGQAVIRYCKNSHGIPTKKSPRWDDDAFFTDREFNKNMGFIVAAIDKIKERVELEGYTTIGLPSAGLGTGRAQMATRCPLTYAEMTQYLVTTLQELRRN